MERRTEGGEEEEGQRGEEKSKGRGGEISFPGSFQKVVDHAHGLWSAASVGVSVSVCSQTLDDTTIYFESACYMYTLWSIETCYFYLFVQ